MAEHSGTWIVVVGWEHDDEPMQAFCSYGPYDHKPTQEDVEVCRQDFLCGMDVTDEEWEESHDIHAVELQRPVNEPYNHYRPSRRG